MADTRTVGVVGVGLLGSAVADVLLKAGYQVLGYDVVQERLAALEAQGGKAARSAADVARSAPAVFIILPTLASVEEAIVGGEGVLEGARPDTIVLQMSTISPALAIRMEEAARARGTAFLDTPVSGTSSMVARRDCVVTVGGDRDAFERCRPVLESLAKRVYHVGACGMGSHMKLVTNLIMGLNGVVLAEGLTLARRAGLDLEQTLEILSQGAALQDPGRPRSPDAPGPIRPLDEDGSLPEGHPVDAGGRPGAARAGAAHGGDAATLYRRGGWGTGQGRPVWHRGPLRGAGRAPPRGTGGPA